MGNLIPIAISGCAGRMGNRIISLAFADEELRVAGAMESEGHQWLNRDIGEQLGIGAKGVKITSDIKKGLNQAKVLIEFTAPNATIAHLEIAKELKVGMVIGTTGLSKDDIALVNKASKSIPVVMAPNMSIGVNLLFGLAGEVTKKLGPGYDVEIIEVHHRFKKDAPSGTAKRLAEIIAEAKGEDLNEAGVYGRKGITGERKPSEIGIHAVRAGDVVGDHTVIFSSLGERIELTHKAHSRDTFALGALRAAKFAANASAGLYDMQDVLK
ncbi:MAG: 4-hydroxy-tetrahydrodipicolinate reductase [Candidatus Omnitrophica bacterium]|nr:4-hydroxy-tetrahydrodipicolinate reductase [Candidatus Omnitrophota bacterium]